MRYAGLAVLLVGCGFSVGASGIDAAPHDVGDDDAAPLSSPRKVVLDTSGITTTLDKVPILVPIAAQVDRTKVADPHKDLRFTTLAGTEIPFEVEAWSPSGEILLWVQVPQILPPPAETAILLHYGHDVGAENPPMVWESFEEVHHFTGNLKDVAENGHDGGAIGTTLIPGYIGNCVAFAGGGDRVTFSGATLSQWTAGTLEMWIRPRYQTLAQIGALQPQVLDNSGSLTLGRFYVVANSLVLQIDVHWGATTSYLHPSLPLDQWSHVAWVYDGDMLRVYRNGVEVSTDNIGPKPFSTAGQLVIGVGAKMEIDELRISQSGRSPDWIKLQHRSMTRGLITFTDPSEP